jgi:uncharacterized protein YceH (UPF0502 family)
LGVDGTELAVIAELLLRGAQTIGELRGRAARMTPIADVSALKPILASLVQKRLLVALTPEGRGQIVAHTLYEPQELERLKAQHGQGGWSAGPAVNQPPAAPPAAGGPEAGAAPRATLPVSSSSVPRPAMDGSGEIAELRREVAQLKDEVSRLRREVEDLWTNLR